MALAQKLSVDMVCWNDQRHPFSLDGNTSWAPVMYVRGRYQPPMVGRLLAVVGTRKPSEYAADMAYHLGMRAAQKGVPVISGMALGIDGQAHRGCLDHGGTTWAVLGTGVDQPYPIQHKALYDRIIDSGGAVLSFFAMGTPPLHVHFPRRNLLIALMARQVVLVQAPQKSGALYTADYAREQGRPVFAVPGPITEAANAGCLHLLRSGQATALWAVEDLFDPDLEAPLPVPPPLKKSRTPEADVLPFPVLMSETSRKHRETAGPSPVEDELTPQARELLPRLPLDKSVHMDTLTAETGLTSAALAPLLIELTVAGLVDQQPGQWFQRRR